MHVAPVPQLRLPGRGQGGHGLLCAAARNRPSACRCPRLPRRRSETALPISMTGDRAMKARNSGCLSTSAMTQPGDQRHQHCQDGEWRSSAAPAADRAARRPGRAAARPAAGTGCTAAGRPPSATTARRPRVPAPPSARCARPRSDRLRRRSRAPRSGSAGRDGAVGRARVRDGHPPPAMSRVKCRPDTSSSARASGLDRPTVRLAGRDRAAGAGGRPRSHHQGQAAGRRGGHGRAAGPGADDRTVPHPRLGEGCLPAHLPAVNEQPPRPRQVREKLPQRGRRRRGDEQVAALPRRLNGESQPDCGH